MISGSDITNELRSSAALPGAHYLDAVIRFERGRRPSSARDHRSIERDRDAALAGIDRLLIQQNGERRSGEWLALPVDVNRGLFGNLRHGRFRYSAARPSANRSTPNGRMAASVSPS